MVNEQDCDEENSVYFNAIRNIWFVNSNENLQEKCVRSIKQYNLDFSVIPYIICERFYLEKNPSSYAKN